MAVEVSRPLANFPPALWDYDAMASLSSNASGLESYTKQVEELKVQVKDMLMASFTNDPAEKVKLIDTLCRLGVSYHFEIEIEEQMNQSFCLVNSKAFGDNDYDLSIVALLFRVFRQHGYKMSSDVFDKFKDNNGNFKSSLSIDVKSMLSLLEGAHLSMHGEEFLDEAIAYARTNLMSMASQCSPHLQKHIANALEQSFHKGIPRIEARKYISFYEKDESHDEMLLKFAKNDFHRLQLLHRQELSDVARWYKGLNVKKNFFYARDRLVETYMWSVSVYFEPHYARARSFLTKITTLLSFTDDTYDAYGTIEELRPFTEAMQRWDISAIDQVPDNMKFLYKTYLDLYNGLEDELRNEGRSHCVSYVKDAIKRGIMSYQIEAEWFNKGHIPPFEEYFENALISTCYNAMATASLLGMEEIAGTKAFEWIARVPKINRASMMICRLMDDIVSSEQEKQREHVATGIECYMKQYNVLEEEVIKIFKKNITESWKDVNESWIKPTEVPIPIQMPVLNLARVMDVLYKFQDAYSINPGRLRGFVEMLFLEPVPM
ncbi:probable terpene synthase 6 [Tripterygium wilfordii]|uniref:probable terpene synthase 6 n=1 Tax=Tripterygium wilfordii TaxID=458696 RepID=UPI0018F84B6A|nr:probable terpene synthase 6 [Tripterygium wilfordii]